MASRGPGEEHRHRRHQQPSSPEGCPRCSSCHRPCRRRRPCSKATGSNRQPAGKSALLNWSNQDLMHFLSKHISLLDRMKARRSSSTMDMPTTRGSNRQVHPCQGILYVSTFVSTRYIPARAASAESKQGYKWPRLGIQPRTRPS